MQSYLHVLIQGSTYVLIVKLIGCFPGADLFDVCYLAQTAVYCLALYSVEAIEVELPLQCGVDRRLLPPTKLGLPAFATF